MDAVINDELRVIKGMIAETRWKNKLVADKLAEGKIDTLQANLLRNNLIYELSASLARLESFAVS
jgi:hypothetical protein